MKTIKHEFQQDSSLLMCDDIAPLVQIASCIDSNQVCKCRSHKNTFFMTIKPALSSDQVTKLTSGIKPKIKFVNVEHISPERISDLLSVALSGNENLMVDYNKRYYGKPDADVCLEDKLADIICNGHHITIMDAEDPYDLNYRKNINKADIIDGLERLKASTDKECIAAYNAWIDDDLDADTADLILQVIAYGERIF